MAISRRHTLITLLVEEFKRIDGSWDERPVKNAPYLYKSNLFENVYDRWKFYNEVNDFPTLLIQIEEENRTHISANVRYGTFLILVRGYVRGDDTIELADNLLEDIEFIIESLHQVPNFCEAGFVDARIINLSTDEGLLQSSHNLGICDVTIEIAYEQRPNV